MERTLREWLGFLRAFLRHPRAVGAIAPSSPYLARAVAGALPPPRSGAGAAGAAPELVAELGAGTGSITRALLARLGPRATLLALEIDPQLCAVLRRDLPDPRLRVVQAPAQRLGEVVAAHATGVGLPTGRAAGFPAGNVAGPVTTAPGHPPAPLVAVISGLPFANFPPAMRHEIVGAAHTALAPGGVFAGYGYAPFALPPVLAAHFGGARRSLVLRNLPPAFVFTSVKQS